MPTVERGARISFGTLLSTLSSTGLLSRKHRAAKRASEETEVLEELAAAIEKGKEQVFPFHPRAGGHPLRLALDRRLHRFRGKGGAAVFELLARVLAGERAAPGLVQHLGGDAAPVALVLLDRSQSLVEVDPAGKVVGLNRAALSASRLSAKACLVAVALEHGLRAAARLRAGDRYDPVKERPRDVQNLLLLLVGFMGTEWSARDLEEDLSEVLAPDDPILSSFAAYSAKLKSGLAGHKATRLDDRVFRDGAVFDRLLPAKKRQVIAAGTLAWYGILTLGLLRLPRRAFARRNPFYETAWWILRSKPGGRRMVKSALFERAVRRLRSFRILSAFEAFWGAWNPGLAQTCLRPVYRWAGGNRRPFVATMATFVYTALVVHPIWFTLLLTGVARALAVFYPVILVRTRVASDDVFILQGVVIAFWLAIGLLVSLPKLLRRRSLASNRKRRT